ncbi:HET-domain-containing protein [Microthyrium microscopicum]|uniref:HET-domain-containing protein n=1 Tax=Microthyrium microscopicum TaxID=703497 RepID=A0A6A6UJ70_9PEZI|nr:HET-domain-containing protein [Microthyrium microscopicum]
METFNLARKWLNKCLNNHSSDCKVATVPELPPRVLDVSLAQRTGQVQLYITSEGAVKAANYLALSYCWGQVHSITTTKSTIEDRRKGISMSELPRTIRDAVKVTIELGYQYLWVDRLCILQGTDSESLDDWKYQCGLMEQIYGQATVTISASAVEDPEGGLFLPRRFALKVAIRETGGAWREEPVLLSCARPSKKSYDEEPINTRAWTMQEYLLSPRVLVYSTRTVTWVCSSGFFKEPLEGNEGVHWSREYIQRLSAINNGYDWHTLVTNYCTRNLSRNNDKLTAFAGIARRFHKQRAKASDRYLAGIWKAQIARDLLWIRVAPAHITTGATFYNPSQHSTSICSTEEYRAPSWSWASIDGGISYPPFTQAASRRSATRILRAETHLENLDEYGSVTGGEIEARGSLLPGWLNFEDSQTGPWVMVDVKSGSEAVTHKKKLGYAFLDDKDGIQRASGNIFCLNLVISGKFVYGLILISVPEKPGYFTRVGVVRIQRAELASKEAPDETIVIL